MHANLLVLLLVAIVTILIGKRVTEKQRQLNKKRKIPAPTWAKQYWHIVPVELRNDLTYEDWESIVKINPFQTRLFCSWDAIRQRTVPVYVSLTTSPERIKYVPIVLNQLDLSCVDEIALNLPRRFGRNQQAYGDIPSSVTSIEKLKIYWHEEDDGPIMKILPTAERHRTNSSNPICISLDDDMCYPRSLIASLVSAQLVMGDKAAIGGMGTDLRQYLVSKDKHNQSGWYERLWPEKVARGAPRDGLLPRDFLEGFGAISYRAHHLNGDALKEMTKASKTCFMSDDLLLNVHMQRSGTLRFKLDQFRINGFSFGNQEDALHIMQHHNSAYGACIDTLKSQ